MKFLVALIFSFSFYFIEASAESTYAASLCGEGSAPDYGFNYDLQQAHWTVDGESYVSSQAIDEVDTILDQLNADSIVQTMILFKPQDQVGNRVNCAVHFLRYMKLGLPTGPRRDNGFVFLIVVEPSKIDVHYGVGLGLPALTAPELTDLNRAAEESYQSTHDMDQALLTLVRGFDRVARNKYPPLAAAQPTADESVPQQLPSGPLGILAMCGQLCLGAIIVLFVLWWLTQAVRGGVSTYTPWGRSYRGTGTGGFPMGGGGSRGSPTPPSSRGGSGSGRSGRGN